MQESLMQLTEGVTNVILVIVSVVATSTVGYFTIQYSKKQHQRASMSDIFRMLDDTQHKSAEKNIRDAYRNGTLMKDGNLNPDHENPASVVTKNYAQVGAMMSSKVIPKRQYYEKFGMMTVISYFVLKESIEQTCKKYPLYRAYFTILAIDCFEYWDGLKVDDKQVEIIDPNGNRITKEMLGKKIKMPRKRFV